MPTMTEAAEAWWRPAPADAAGWLALPRCALPGPTIPEILLHPGLGIALLGVVPAAADAAATAVRERLAAARVPAIFPGWLPILVTAARPVDPALLAEGFARLPPLDLAGGDAWVAAAWRALSAQAERRPPAVPMRRPRPRPRRRRWALIAGLGLLAGLALGLGLGGGRVPPDPQWAPVTEPRPAALAPLAPTPLAPTPLVPEPSGVSPPPAEARPPIAAPAPIPAEAEPPDLPRAATRSAANLRADPDNGARILRTVAGGEEFLVHGEAKGGWVQVGGAAGPEGWIHSRLLRPMQ
jgi:hypothetical protein